jgi:hypothetical protein
VQWSPRVAGTVVTAVAGLGLALAVLTVDPVGRGLVGGAALGLLAVAAQDALVRPRLRAGVVGVTARRLTGSTEIAWPVLQVRVRSQRRWGVRSTTLELEDRSDDAVLVVLGRRELGADPAVVAEALHAAGAGSWPLG